MNRMPVILLLGLIIMFELIPSIAATVKIFSISTTLIVLPLLIGFQVATAFLAGISIYLLWRNHRFSKIFTLIIQYVVIAIPLIYMSLLAVGFSFHYKIDGILFLLVFTSGVAAFLAFINIIILGFLFREIGLS